MRPHSRDTAPRARLQPRGQDEAHARGAGRRVRVGILACGRGRVGLLGCGGRRAGRRVQGEGAAAECHQCRRAGHRVGRMGEYRGQADECRAENERQLVQGALEGEGRADDALRDAGAAGEGDQAGACQRADERHGDARGGPQEGQDGRRQPGERAGDERGDGEAVGEREREHHRPLSVPVREPPDQRPAGHLAEREGATGQAGRAEGPRSCGRRAARCRTGRWPWAAGRGTTRTAAAVPSGRSPAGRVSLVRRRPLLPRCPHRSNVGTRRDPGSGR